MAVAIVKENADHDITVFGCTGNAGRAVAFQVIRSATAACHPKGELRIALAGRNKSKVEAVLDGIMTELKLANDEERDIRGRTNVVVANADDQASLLALTKGSKVVISCAGPYGRYGEAMVKACIEGQAHYLDLTGEVEWVGSMLSKYQKQALDQGVALLSFSGYDCVPAEIGMFLAARLLTERSPAAKAKQVNLVFTNEGGGFPKGTLETILDAADGCGAVKQQGDVNFIPNEYRATAQGALGSWDRRLPSWSSLLGVFTAPNYMTKINIPVLCRAAPSLGLPTNLVITDRSVLKKPTLTNGYGLLPSISYCLISASWSVLMLFPMFRSWVRNKLKTYNFFGNAAGRVVVDAEAVSETGASRAAVRLDIPGDAGIYATGLFAAAVANSVHQGTKSLLAGFHSPVVGLCSKGSDREGKILIDNMKRLGTTITEFN